MILCFLFFDQNANFIWNITSSSKTLTSAAKPKCNKKVSGNDGILHVLKSRQNENIHHHPKQTKPQKWKQWQENAGCSFLNMHGNNLPLVESFWVVFLNTCCFFEHLNEWFNQIIIWNVVLSATQKHNTATGITCICVIFLLKKSFKLYI